MSVNLRKRVDGPGSADHVADAWALKERIREAEDVLKQRRGFFEDAYRRSTTHLLFESTPGDGEAELVGFASARRDGYVLFLAVAPEARGRGYGERLVAEVADDTRSVTCHARTTNESALAFYDHLGFEVEREIHNYYEDGGDAYYLKLGSAGGLADRLSKLLR